MTDTTGQPSEGTQTTVTGTETTGSGTDGQVNTDQTTTSGTEAEETFFDPTQVSEELKPAYKLMQRAFSEKTQQLSAGKQKVEMYDRFMQNPVGMIRQLASQYGMTIAEATAAATQQQNGQWTPQTWEEVVQKVTEKAKEEAKRELLGDLQPLVREVQETKKTQIEKMLDENAPDWKLYEDKMTENLQKHPTLSSDPLLLYEVSLPRNVRESRATQAALKKIESKAKSSQVSGGSMTSNASDTPSGPLSFQQAYEFARQKIARGGA